MQRAKLETAKIKMADGHGQLNNSIRQLWEKIIITWSNKQKYSIISTIHLCLLKYLATVYFHYKDPPKYYIVRCRLEYMDEY